MYIEKKSVVNCTVPNQLKNGNYLFFKFQTIYSIQESLLFHIDNRQISSPHIIIL
jgi:hypothetical protein